MRLALAVFAAAVALAVAERCARAVGIGRSRPDATPESVIRVCIVCPIRVDAARVVEDILQRSLAPRRLRFGVLYELSDARDVLDGAARELPSFLKGLVDVHTTTPCRDAEHRLRRVARYFVAGDETAVVYVDYRLRLQPRWDGRLGAIPTDAALTVPCSHEHDASFAVARQDGARAVLTTPFATTEPGRIVQGAVFCCEFVAAAPHVWTARALASAPLCTAAFAVLQPVTKHLAVALAQESLARRAPPPMPNALIGLSAEPDTTETVFKYGSHERSRLALKLMR